MTDITLQSTGINSGTTVTLNGASVKYAFKPLTRTTPYATSFTLSESQISGFENPKIIVTGYIDVNNIPTNGITMPLLRDFALNRYDGTEAKSIYLKIKSGRINPKYLVGTASSTSWSTDQTIKVIVESFDISMASSDSDYAHFWTYTLNLVETA